MKRNPKIIIGWILIVAQCLALIGKLANGAPFTSFFNVLGFFSFSIVGAILLYLGYKQEK